MFSKEAIIEQGNIVVVEPLMTTEGEIFGMYLQVSGLTPKAVIQLLKLTIKDLEREVNNV